MQRATRRRLRHTATEARRRRPNRRTKWAEEATNDKKKKNWSKEGSSGHWSKRLKQGEDRRAKKHRKQNEREEIPRRVEETNIGVPPFGAQKTKPNIRREYYKRM